MILSQQHERYLKLAEHIATWSKDPSSKIGALAVGSKGQLLSQGYNGFPRGIKDTEERWNDRPTKYSYVVHAEMNMIYNASLNGVSLSGSVVYIAGIPICSECTKGIIQSGITEVHMKPNEVDWELRWGESIVLSLSMLEEANVGWMIYDKDYKAEKWFEKYYRIVWTSHD